MGGSSIEAVICIIDIVSLKRGQDMIDQVTEKVVLDEDIEIETIAGEDQNRWVTHTYMRR